MRFVIFTIPLLLLCFLLIFSGRVYYIYYSPLDAERCRHCEKNSNRVDNDYENPYVLYSYGVLYDEYNAFLEENGSEIEGVKEKPSDMSIPASERIIEELDISIEDIGKSRSLYVGRVYRYGIIEYCRLFLRSKKLGICLPDMENEIATGIDKNFDYKKYYDIVTRDGVDITSMNFEPNKNHFQRVFLIRR